MGNGNRGNIMIIKNGLVFTPEGKFEKKDLYVEGEYVAKETTDNKEVEAEGCYVIPGLVDIHFHGCVRHDMCAGTEESIQALADYEASNGVLAICPATMTIPEEELFQAMKAAKGHKNGKGADLVHFFNEDGLGAIVISSRGIIAAYKQEKYKEFGAENYADASRAVVKDRIADISGALENR